MSDSNIIWEDYTDAEALCLAASWRTCGVIIALTDHHLEIAKKAITADIGRDPDIATIEGDPDIDDPMDHYYAWLNEDGSVIIALTT